MEILFVCTGNTCRSPMAEGIFNVKAAREGLAIHASSCGTSAFSVPASANAVDAAARFGADISGHVARQINEFILDAADYVFCMTARHAYALKSAFPECADKVFTLSDRDVSDPYGGSAEDYADTAMQIADAIDALIPKLKEKLK